MQIRNIKNAYKDDKTINGGTVIIEVHDNILGVKDDLVTTEYKVSDIEHVIEYKKIVFISFASTTNIIIPTTAFKDNIEKLNFMNLLSKKE